MNSRSFGVFESNTNLTAGSTYTGPAYDMRARSEFAVSATNKQYEKEYSRFGATVTSSHDSAALGFQIQGSLDGSTGWTVLDQTTLTVATKTTASLSVQNIMPFMRVVYVNNGTTGTTSLMITTHWE